MTAPIGVLVMAYGTADGPDDIERYYTDIRGRPPTSEHLQELRDRYAAIGNRFPLMDITRQQAEGIERELNARGGWQTFRVYLGMKHSPPFIPETVERMRDPLCEERHEPRVVVIAPDEREGRPALGGGVADALDVGLHGHPRPVRRHDDTDRVLDAVGAHLLERIGDPGR